MHYFKKKFAATHILFLRHKIFGSFLVLCLLGGGYYIVNVFFFSSSTNSRYVLTAVEKGTLVTSVEGSGQVSVSSQIDLKPKVSGDVVFVPVTEGQMVKAGDLIAQIDSRDATKTVRDAQNSLSGAELSLEKLKQPADQLTLLQAQNALAQAQNSKTEAQSNIEKAYDDGFNTVSNAFGQLSTIMPGLNSILNGTGVNANQANVFAYYDLIKTYKPTADQLRDVSIQKYADARSSYEKSLQDYKNASRYSDRETIANLVSETYQTTKLVSESIKATQTFLDLVNDTLISVQAKSPSLLATHRSDLQSYTTTANSQFGSVFTAYDVIKNQTNSLASADQAIAEKTENLAKIKNGADPLDIQSQELNVQQKRNNLLDAQAELANYYIRSPFDGVLAKLNVKKGDSVSSATALATVITTQQIAQISFNEVDIAKVKLNQKATLTFDAIDGLTLTGHVAQMDTIGTVSQGVVTYNVKIAFDVQDDRVKPGMSVAAAIITNTFSDVLFVPSSAIKKQGASSYVEILDGFTTANSDTLSAQGVSSSNLPTRKTVTVGASNDVSTQILEGLSEGEIIVERTIAASTPASTQSGSTGLRIPGFGGVGGTVRTTGGGTGR